MLPWLTAMAWASYGLTIFVALLALNQGSFFKLWSAAFGFYGGVNLMRGWVQRRVEPR
jgi:hypothetical protein